jgi:carboxyl-terminal processing protease
MLNGDDDKTQNGPGQESPPAGWDPADYPGDSGPSDELEPGAGAGLEAGSGAGASAPEPERAAQSGAAWPEPSAPISGPFAPPAGASLWQAPAPQPAQPAQPGQPTGGSWQAQQAPAGWPPAQQGPAPWQATPPWPPQPPQPTQPQQPWPPQGWPPQPQQPWQQPPAWPPARPPQPGWQPVPSWQPAAGQPSTLPSTPTGAGSALPSALPARRAKLPQVLAVVAACLISFAGGMAFDRLAFAPQPTSTTQPSAVAADVPLQDFQLYEQALQIVKKNFVGRSDVTDQQLLYGSIRGMIDALGDTGHSTFLTPEEYQASQSELSGNIAGIGVLLSTDNGQFVVTKVLSGTPAQAAGVEAGDQITAVDGAPVSGLSFDVFASKIRGKAGTQVTLTVVRAGVADPIDITITREVIAVPLVSWGIVPGSHVADIALFEFSTGAADQVQSAITSATSAGATSIVLDLRGNPGGYADEATNVASEFLSSGNVYLTEDAAGNRTNIPVNASMSHTNLPMVVLVDHSSASAAEIVAGALQDNKRATIVGESTYGTGTVLQQFKLSDGSAILLGTAYWLTPSGNKIFGKGITPDQTVALPAGAQPLDPSQLSSMTASQLSTSGDAELIAAVNDLNK